MKKAENVWGIKEYEGDGKNCPIIPKNLPWYKKLFLTFFRFGICPICITSSLLYSGKRAILRLFGKSEQRLIKESL